MIHEFSDLAFTILSFKFAPEILVILPLFMIYQRIGLYDSYFGLIWVYQLITLPLLIWVLRGYFEEISVEIEQAAKDAFAHDFILKLDGGLGYDTLVGERGGRLSGGQRQRIALARAFLRNAPILILDEATSALDTESEAFIQKALQKLVVGKTVLIIAHRFSTIRDASMILVFDKGSIVAQGNHATLYSGSELYRGLYDKQSTAAHATAS